MTDQRHHDVNGGLAISSRQQPQEAAATATPHLQRGESTYFDYALRNPGISVIARPLSYPLVASAPLFVTMVGMGFAYRHQCPLHSRIPQFLFFAGLAGTMSVVLRMLLIVKWRSIKAKYDKK